MTALENYKINGLTFDQFKIRFSPEVIASYVADHLPRMYTGTSPSLGQMKDAYGERNTRQWIDIMLMAILNFAGVASKFAPSQIPITEGNILTQYAGMKATEFMHFVFLMQNGEYEKFYGNPTGDKLLKSLKDYFYGTCQPLRLRYAQALQREENVIEQARRQAERNGYTSEMVAQQIAEAFSEENAAKQREWRQEPWGTAMCIAFSSVDRVDWIERPWEWPYERRKQWAMDNAALVRAHPNLNQAPQN